MYQHQNTGYNVAAQPATQATNYWALDESSAAAAGENDYINETGLYVATIERAEYIKAGTGSHGLLVRFDAVVNGVPKKGSFIVNYAKANNEKIFGADFINAMLYMSDLRGFT